MQERDSKTYDLAHLEYAQVRGLYDLVKRGLAKVELSVTYVDLTSLPARERKARKTRTAA